VDVGVGLGEADGLAEALDVVGVTLGDCEADEAGAVAAGALEVVLAAGAEQAARGSAKTSGTRMDLRTRRGVMAVPFLGVAGQTSLPSEYPPRIFAAPPELPCWPW